MLGRPELCAGFSPRQRELLQLILREGTRVKANPEKDGKVQINLEVLQGNRLPNHCGRKWLQCPLLDENRSYNGFNGNKFRRGLGYLLTSPGGWMTKADYRPSGSTFKTSDIRLFLDDLAVLSERLNLVVVGLDRHSESLWLGIEALRNLCNARGFQQILERLHLRFYAQAGWEARWRIFFEGSPEASQRPDLRELVSKLHQLPITQKQVAVELNVNPSFLCKLLSGKKKCLKHCWSEPAAFSSNNVRQRLIRPSARCPIH